MRTKLELALIPLSRLNAVLGPAGYAPFTQKADAVSVVNTLIESGRITLDEVKNGTVSIAATSASATTQVHPILQSDQTELVERIVALELQASTALDLAQQATKLAQSVEQRPAPKAKNVAAEVDRAVSQAVSAAFDAFRETRTEQEMREIATTIPPARETRRAGDVFPSTSYGKTDFADLPVEVWPCQGPALVDDYVFQEQHLHAALLAIRGDLPHNVWLAGERGTGKTEFVTQLAARLNRPFYRVNFDEALERADFLGGNSIESGNVVWKPGVITRAIQTPGAIILLDEIGFARAQALAVLHSLCERSPHRSVTVAETGERIPVAPGVVFFCADNSNGHGDTSGNFAGVRDQNTAFIDRFSYTLRFDYLSPLFEIDLIASRTNIPVKAARKIVEFATIARQKARDGLLTQPPSLRQLFAFADAVGAGLPVDIAFANAIVNKFPQDCAPELLGIYAAAIDADEFASSLGG